MINRKKSFRIPGMTDIDPPYDISMIFPDSIDRRGSAEYDANIEEHPMIRMKRKY